MASQVVSPKGKDAKEQMRGTHIERIHHESFHKFQGDSYAEIESQLSSSETAA